MKQVLDACCGSRMMWFDKHDPRALFGDIRAEELTACDGRTITIAPDTTLDFRNLPCPDNTFRLVVFDPPHLHHLGKSSWLAQKFGALAPSWRDDIAQGFSECFRVLRTSGVLIFKWSEVQIPLSEILALTPEKPLFGHTTTQNLRTHWITFMKEEDTA